MTVESARRVLTVASSLAEQGRRLIEQAAEWRALALTGVPAGTVLTFDAGNPRLRLDRWDVTLAPTGAWLRADGQPVPTEWVAQWWDRGNLRLPTADGS